MSSCNRREKPLDVAPQGSAGLRVVSDVLCLSALLQPESHITSPAHAGLEDHLQEGLCLLWPKLQVWTQQLAST